MGLQTTRIGVLWVFVFLLAAGTAHGDADARTRARARQQRERTRKKNVEQQARIRALFERDFKKIIESCLKYGLLDLGWEFVRDISRRDPDVAVIEETGAMLDRARAQSPAESPPDDAAAKLRARYRSIAKKCGTKLKGHAERLLRKGELELAYTCFLEALRYVPESNISQRYVRAKFDAERNRWVPNCVTDGYESNGRVWDRRLGWIVKGHADKYAAGLYPQFQEGVVIRWVKLEALNKSHHRISNPWLVETKHYSIRASTDLQNAVAVANWLEEFYPPWIATFSRLFHDKAKDLLFGASKQPLLKVRIMHDEEMWKKWNRSNSDSEDDDHGDSGGYFDPATKESLFYVSNGLREIARHEVSHQLLDRAIGAHSAALTTAIDEGLAVFVETAHIGSFALVGSGVAVLAFSDARREWLLSKKRPPLPKFFNFTYHEFHDSEYELEHYMLAGLWTAFFFRYRDGLYSDDYVELVQNESWKQPGSAIQKRFGVNPIALEKEFETWLRRQLDIMGLETGSTVSSTYSESLHRGRAFLDVGKLLEARVTLRLARDYYQRELDVPSDDTRWRLAASHELLARAYRNAGEGRQAKGSVALAIPYREKLPEYGGTTPKRLAACHAFLGLLHAESGWLVSAQEALEGALKVLEAQRKKKPKRPDTWFLLPAVHARLGEVHQEQGNKEKAAHHFAQAKAKYPGDPDLNIVQAWFLATCIAKEQRHAKRAVALARYATERNEESSWYRLVLGIALLRNGEPKPALEQLTQSMKQSGGGCGLHWSAIAIAQKKQGNDSEAKKWAKHKEKNNEWAAIPDWATKSDIARMNTEAAALLR